MDAVAGARTPPCFEGGKDASPRIWKYAYTTKGGMAGRLRELPGQPEMALQEMRDSKILSSKIALALMAGTASMSFATPAFAAENTAVTDTADSASVNTSADLALETGHTVGTTSSESQSNNSFTVSSKADYAIGGYDAEEAGGSGITNNHVTIADGAVLGETTAANFNRGSQGYDHQDGSYIAFSATAGYSENNDVTNSSVEMNGGTANGNVIGAVAFNGNAKGNSVVMNGGTIASDGEDSNDLVGAAALGDATNNTAVLNNGTVSGVVIGGQGETTATGNKAIINGGTTQQAIGGYSYSGWGDTNNNTVEVNGGTVDGDVMGGQTKSNGSANGNTVIYNGGTVNGNVIGGAFQTKSRAEIGTNTANNNTVVLNAALKTQGYLYGGLDHANAKIGTSDVLKGNRLVVNSVGNEVNNIYNFESMDVNASNIKNGDTVITVNNINDVDTDLTQTKVDVEGSTSAKDGLKTGDRFTVVSKADAGTLKTKDVEGSITKGVSKEYDLSFDNDGKNLTATVGNGRMADQTKVFTGAQVAQSQLVNLGGDAIDDIASSFTSANKGDKTPWVHATQDRGHVGDFYGTNSLFNVGVANTKVSGDKVTTVAPFIEYGHGSFGYDASKVNASGSTDLFGVGAIYRTMNESTGSYFTGAARIGHVKGDLSAHNMKGANGKNVTFDADGTYFAGQLRVGKIHAEGDREFVDEYAGFYFSHTPSESAEMSTGEDYSFDAINSARLRVGIRHNRDTGKGVQYVGAYIQHEFAGDATGSFDGLETPGTQLKGTSAVGEVGYRQDVDENHKIGHDVAIKGYGSFGGWSANRYGVQLNATVMGKF